MKKLNTSADTANISPVNFNAFTQNSRVWTASNKWKKTVEVLKKSLSDDNVVITDQFGSFEFANVISKTEQKVSEFDRY